MSETPITDKTKGRKHTYHSEANVLTGFLTLPLNQKIQPQAYANLPGEGGYFDQRLENYKLGEVISIRSAYTQVAGNLDPKEDKGWSTLTTTVVEGFNVLDVLTADRIVGQIITEYPLVGYIPKISFLGTRFENLRIAGHPIEVDIATDLFTRHSTWSKLSHAYENDQAFRSEVGKLSMIQAKGKKLPEGHGTLGVTLARNLDKLPRGLERRDHGIYVPHFGTVYLAEYFISRHAQRLLMLHVDLGCAVEGRGGLGCGQNNGSTYP